MAHVQLELLQLGQPLQQLAHEGPDGFVEGLDALGHDEVEGEFDKFLADAALDVVGGFDEFLALLDALGLLVHLLVHVAPDLLQCVLVLFGHGSFLVEHLQQVFLADLFDHLLDVLFLSLLVLWLTRYELAFAGNRVLDGVLRVDALQVFYYFLAVLVDSVLA